MNEKMNECNESLEILPCRSPLKIKTKDELFDAEYPPLHFVRGDSVLFDFFPGDA